MKSLFTLLLEAFLNLGFLEKYANLSAVLISFLGLVILAFILHWITKEIVLKLIKQFVANTKTEWDDYLLKRKVFHSISHLTSALLFYYSAGFSGIPEVTKLLTNFANVYLVIIFVRTISAFLNAANDIYLTTPYSANRSIKGYIQLIMIFVYFMAGIFIISIIIGKSPIVLFTGLGAFAVVLLLVFKDTILGFVASIQLSANRMLKPGDWIEMPKYNANGTVIDITLNTVKIQNFDKTITTIPTYALVSESFMNWSGMEESDGRRIKRSINIDMKSVRFCDAALLERFKKFLLLKDYVVEKHQEIIEFNRKLGIDDEMYPNGRRLTNLGIFRKYLEIYLKNNPNINLDMTFLVRQLQPTETGLPLEIYVFSKNKNWNAYEAIQADIFDHILAIVPEFDLRIFQSPSGNDIQDLASKLHIDQR